MGRHYCEKNGDFGQSPDLINQNYKRQSADNLALAPECQANNGLSWRCIPTGGFGEESPDGPRWSRGLLQLFDLI